MKRKVLNSINNADGSLCVDIFQRPDGTFGFEEYRRDPEDSRGWYPVGGFEDVVCPNQERAHAAAIDAVAWFKG
jgi:hypothetical protein